MFDKRVAYFPVNGKYCEWATLLNIPTNPSKNKHPLIMKYETRIFNLRPPKLKLINVWDVDILFDVPCSQIQY